MSVGVAVSLCLLLIVGGTCALLLLAGHLYGRAEYDAWGEQNVDRRLFVSGLLAGLAIAWFSHADDLAEALAPPSHLSADAP